MATPPVKVALNPCQKSELEKIKNIARRGEYVAKIHLQSKYYDKVDFECDRIPGADISVLLDGVATAFEVKATKDTTIALSKLKVSSKNSHDLIVGGATVVRVMGWIKPPQ